MFIKRVIKNIIHFFKKYKDLFLLLILAFLIFVFLSKIYELFFANFIYAKFTDLGPLSKKMPVYFRGYKIGKIRKIRPSDDYTYTIVRIRIFAKNLKLPINTIAQVKKRDRKKNYIELVYPDSPSIVNLKRGDEIEGRAAFDFKEYFTSQVDSGVLDKITGNTSNAIASVERTSDEIQGLIADFRAILKENKPNIKSTTDNAVLITENAAIMIDFLGLMSKDLSEIAHKLNLSIKEDKIDGTMSNITSASDNIVATTKNIKDASKNVVDITKNVEIASAKLENTVSKIDATIDGAHTVMSNVSAITCGFRKLLSKRFAGLKLFFGKPMECECEVRTCAK